MINQFWKRALPLVALGLGGALTGCGSNVDITINGAEGVPLADLDMSGPAPDELIVSAGDKVVVTEGDELKITVEGDDAAIESLRFVRDGDMIGVTREENWDSNGSATVRITMAPPSEVTIGGSGAIELPSTAKEAEATIGGSGTIRIAEIDADKFEIAIGGSGDISAAGAVKQLEIAVGGSGSVNFGEVMADDVQISIGGSGDVALQSNGSVEASIGGSGDINVTGSAKCTLNSAGSGTLHCKPATEKTAIEAPTKINEAGEE